VPSGPEWVRIGATSPEHAWNERVEDCLRRFFIQKMKIRGPRRWLHSSGRKMQNKPNAAFERSNTKN
jgi:hypothetical protein